ncbi:hypothetical protein H2200_006766 [Cladophialophora chaetospira]|uniref:Zn(2)-C6 fungal-type domain-containing protein n=1 Tax=Cladophialophora chaetospira TaxID=386627 RepID=A0AA38X8Z3_9EURO|nr:hypothetical protein H2200_006766 [Cladophialophora chaetospira]
MAGLGRHATKTRTACLTCKKRRVKCGLERPSCARCLKAGRTCDGYQLSVVEGFPVRTTKDTAPLHLSNTSSLLSAFRATQPEWQAYGYYHHRISSVLAGAFESDLWQRMIVQVAETEPTVRQGIFALGNLFRHSQCFSDDIADCMCTHCRQALRYYGKSIRSFSNYLQRSSTQCAADVALLTCLIYICIESYRMNDVNAIALISKGCGMITEASPESADSQSKALSPRLVNLFDRLWLLANMFGSRKPRPTARPSQVLIPSQFPPIDTVETARNRLHDIVASIQSLRLRVFQSQYYAKSDVERYAAIEGLLGEQEALVLTLIDWQHDFQDLVQRPGLEMLQQSQVWYILTVQYLIAKISASASMDPAARESEDQSEDFINLVAVAELGLTKYPPTAEAKRYSFESPFLPALYLTTRKCRNPIIRRKALELMSLTGVKEGLWYRSELMCIGARVIELEEGLAILGSDEQPEPSDRQTLRFYDVLVELNYRKAGKTLVDITYLIYDTNLDERWRYMKETLTIGE